MFQSVIVLLYVMDNETNTVIIISCFVGLLIEIWKINKAVNIKVRTYFSIFYSVYFCEGYYKKNLRLLLSLSKVAKVKIQQTFQISISKMLKNK